MTINMTTLDDETPGRSCEECEADLSNLASDARFCPFCSAELEPIEVEGNEDEDIEDEDE